MARHNELGKLGEELAVTHLLGKGYEILARNYRYKRLEVDIIARKAAILSVVEVKTRSTADFGDPQDFLRPRQIKSLVTAIDFFVQDNELDVEVRFDIIAIVLNKRETRIEHLEDAFLHF